MKFMREIVFDTETTGLDKGQDRIIEIGCVVMDSLSAHKSQRVRHLIEQAGTTLLFLASLCARP